MNENVQELKNLIDIQKTALDKIVLDDDMFSIINLINEKIHNNNGRVVTTGVGKAGEIARIFSKTLCSTGTPSLFLHPLEAVHGDLGVLSEHNVLFLFSNSGKTREIIELIPIAKRLYSDLSIVGLTGQKKSPLAELCDYNILIGEQTELCPLKLTPTNSCLAMLAVSNMIVNLLIKKIDFTLEAYGKRHHGGYLGKVVKENLQNDKD